MEPPTMRDNDRVVLACIQAVRRRRGVEPFSFAQQVKGWTRERWDRVWAEHQDARIVRMCGQAPVEQ